jgi:predicted lipoprotein with Yx(FWY)xxD motif
MAAKSKILFGAGVVLLVLLGATAAYASNGPGTSFHKTWRGHHSPGTRDRGSAVVALESSPYGPVLVVGGAGAGYVPADPTANPPTPASYNYPTGSSLYFLTSDPPTYGQGWGHAGYQAACGTTVVATQGFTCTSSPSADTGEWPALLTWGPPIAGPGVNPGLLGTVYRADLGAFQVTYADHPLYLFDQGPNSFVGQNFFESVSPLPPWGGLWSLLSPDGLPASTVANLETEAPVTGQTTYSSPAVGVQEYPYGDQLGATPPIPPSGVTISVYAFSGDSPWQSRCAGACTLTWIPVWTSGPPTAGAGLNGHVGAIRRPDGSYQATYDGHPLYLYGQEQPVIESGAPSYAGTVGNGNGVHAFGGTFRLVRP